jgi:hypothetical protein
MSRIPLRPFFVLGLLAYAACGEEGAPVEIHSYIDASGRSCSTDVNDISGLADCDADPTAATTCTAPQTAEFVVNDDFDFETRIWTLESCAACVDRAERTSYIDSDTCATITCETDADCLQDRYTCMAGVCQDHE